MSAIEQRHAEAFAPRPARGYSWPPFEKGNTHGLRHGARSRRVYEPIAEELVAGLLEERPDLRDYPDALTAWGESEARAELLRKWIAEQGMFDGKDLPRSGVLTWLRAFESQAQEARRTLGLDPRSHAELVRVRAEATTQTVDVEALLARGREAVVAAEARHALAAAQESAGGAASPEDGRQDQEPDSGAQSAATDPTAGAVGGTSVDEPIRGRAGHSARVGDTS